jgi:hypothetical protein
VLTQAELIDEIVKRTAPQGRVASVRGWLGRARDLVAQVVAKGLHLPEAAKLLRGSPTPLPKPPPPLPTVTLAEIYAAQGHLTKAIAVLDQVLERESDHRVAADLRHRLADQLAPKAGGKTEIADAASAVAGTAAVAEEPSRDDVVALATDARTVYVYWEARPVRYARVRSDHPEGELVLRVLCSHSSTAGVGVVTHDVSIDALVGDTFVRGLPVGSEVRICLAWKSGSALVPLCVAPPLQLPRAYQLAGEAADAAPPSTEPERGHERGAVTKQNSDDQLVPGHFRGGPEYPRQKRDTHGRVPVADFGPKSRPRWSPLEPPQPATSAEFRMSS